MLLLMICPTVDGNHHQTTVSFATLPCLTLRRLYRPNSLVFLEFVWYNTHCLWLLFSTTTYIHKCQLFVFAIYTHSIKLVVHPVINRFEQVGLAIAIWEPRYKYFRSSGRHIGILTSGLIREYSLLAHWNAGPRKCGICRWNFVSISSRSPDISISSLATAILKILTSGYMREHSLLVQWKAGPRKCGDSLLNYVSIISRSWDIIFYMSGVKNYPAQ